MALSPLERIAERLERENLRLEAAAIRAVNASYRSLSLADLLALVAQVSESPAPAYRVAQLDRLLGAYYRAVGTLETPPQDLTALLESAVRQTVTAAEEMVRGAGGLLEAFRVPPTRELEYTRHSADRLTRYWGTERERRAREVQSVLIEGLERGKGTRQIATQLRERIGVSRSRAQLIASNELGNASAHAMRESQLEAGVERFVWRSAADARVRPEHRARNGREYRWDDPPNGEVPGQPVRCRCVALAVLPES